MDGFGVGDVGSVVLRDRKPPLAEDGMVIVVATVNNATGQLLAGPDLVSRGFVYVHDRRTDGRGPGRLVQNTFEKCRGEHVRDWSAVKTRRAEQLPPQRKPSAAP